MISLVRHLSLIGVYLYERNNEIEDFLVHEIAVNRRLRQRHGLNYQISPAKHLDFDSNAEKIVGYRRKLKVA